jgi:hypothetical protein
MISDPHLQVYAINFNCETKQKNLTIDNFPYYSFVVQCASKLGWSLVTTAWRISRVRIYKIASRYADSCEYIE